MLYNSFPPLCLQTCLQAYNSYISQYLKDLYENVVLKYGIEKIPFSDPIFTYAALLNGKRYYYTETLDMSLIRKMSKRDSILNTNPTMRDRKLANHTLFLNRTFQFSCISYNPFLFISVSFVKPYM